MTGAMRLEDGTGGTSLDIVILGLAVTSSWGNGHATTYRALMRELHARGHRVLFLERDVPWYAAHRDLKTMPYGRCELYDDLADLKKRFSNEVQAADFVLVGSYVPEGVAVGRWVLTTAHGPVGFYDIDTPVTLAKLRRGDDEYLSEELIPRYDIYLSFTSGPTLTLLEDHYGAPVARPLYCSVDAGRYYPEPRPCRWDLGYMGTYSDDRQPTLDRLLFEPARRRPERSFAVAGSQYPDDLVWPDNVEPLGHLPPEEHRAFYNSQRFTLNITRADMIEAGYSPSVRLFEASACGIPIISDPWPGIETFFEIDSEILIARSSDEVLVHLRSLTDAERRAIGERARERVLSEHTAARRAEELEGYIQSVLAGRTPPVPPSSERDQGRRLAHQGLGSRLRSHALDEKAS